MRDKAKQIKVKVREIEKIKKNIFLISFSSPYLSRNSEPGNFLHVKIKNVILRRPFSIHKTKGDKVYMLFKVKGRGTAALSESRKGDVLDIIGPLGRGFSYKKAEKGPAVIVAGGIGVAPLMFLAQKISAAKKIDSGYERIVLLGAQSGEDVLCEKEFRKLGYKVYVATEDGAKGRKGFVTDILKNVLAGFDVNEKVNVYSCGPENMFLEMNNIIKEYPGVKCEVSFEQFMGCGLGICCGCTIETKAGYKKVCKDGPVFKLREVW